MNSFKQAKYSVMNSYHNGAYFELPIPYKKNTDIAKIAIMKSKDNVRQIASILGEYMNYHEITDQGSLELIIMLEHILTPEQKKIISFSLYEEIINRIALTNTFEELYNKYKNKVVLHYLLDRQLDLLFSSFKVNRESTDHIILYILNYYDPILGSYLTDNPNILNKYVIAKEKKLTI